MTLVGLEPTISGSVDRCLIHWATGPSDGNVDQDPGIDFIIRCISSQHEFFLKIAGKRGVHKSKIPPLGLEPRSLG